MEYYLDDCRNNSELLCKDYLPLSNLLNQNFEHWNFGSGDSCIRLYNADDGIIFFKTKYGIFIQDLSSMTAPLININESANTITHYVGGEPFDVPDICLVDEKEALKILCYSIENKGELHPEYNWVDIYDYIPFRYDEHPEK